MKIEGNQKELDAMVEFHKGNRVEGLHIAELIGRVCEAKRPHSVSERSARALS